jgi:hypothetical protein
MLTRIQQEIDQMDDDDAVLVADGKTIQRHDVFG